MSASRRKWTVGLTAVAVVLSATGWVVAQRAGRPAGGTPTVVAPAGPATEAEASRRSRAAGVPVEVTGARTANRDVHANPDGTFTENVYQEPVRIRRDGGWVPTDPTLVRYPDGLVRPRAAVTGLVLSGGGTRDFATVERAGRRYTLSWPAPLPAPRLAGATATYPQVLPGVDLVARATVTGFTHVLVVRTPEAARQPAVREVRFGVRTTLLRLRPSAAGGLEMRDAGSGGLVFATGTPYMWDSSAAVPGQDPSRAAPDGGRHARMRLRLGAGSLTLLPDAGMLDDPATRFPVYLDPHTAGVSNESRAMVDSGYPNEAYWNFDGDDHQRIGYCPGLSGCNNSLVKRLFYVLPTNFSGRTILNAKFRVTMAQAFNTTPRAVSLYRAGSGGALITTGTTWRNMPGGAGMSGFVRQSTISPTGTTGCETGATRNTEFDAFEGVRNAAQKGWSKTTFVLRADNESNNQHTKRFCRNAVLSVTYNRAPYQPALSALSMAPGGACVSGSARPYVSSLPVLKATLSDPDTADAELLRAVFRVTWTPPGGTQQTKTWTSPQLANGATFSYNLADATSGVPALPENVVTQWRVHATDGVADGVASSPSCEFILDKTKPAGPDIDSPEYLPGDAGDPTPSCVDDATWWPGVGRYGTFTFDTAATDVNRYWYGFDTNPSEANAVTPATDGGPVTVRWLPDTEGPHVLNVVAVDRAGKQSDISSCVFRVAAGTGPVAEWRLDEPVGSTTAADSAGGRAATAGTGVIFGVPGPGGPADSAARLDGTTAGSLTAPPGIVDTGKPMTASAWVRLTEDTRWQTLLTIDGTGETAFRLSYTASSKRWMAETPMTDTQSLGYWGVVGAPAVKDKWTHLTVLLDPVAGTMSIAVDGGTPVTATRHFAWTGHGQVQIGRRFIRPYVNGDVFFGDVADVRFYDRLLSPAEITALPRQVTSRLAYWDLDGVTELDDQPPLVGRSSGYGPSTDLDPALEVGLYTGASHYRRLAPEEPGYDPFAPAPLVGDGHLVLDGATGYAATAGPVAVTDRSFSVSARVRLATGCTTAPMSVLSQPGTRTSAFDLGCAPDGGGGARWRVVLPGADAAAPAATVVSADSLRPDPSASGGQFLTVTYDDAYRTLRLYVDGQLAGEATDVPPTWVAPGGLQIGRSLVDSTWGRYLAGVVDEVRVYSGPLDSETVQRLNSLTAQPEL